LPAIAALGAVLVPAGIYAQLNRGTEGGLGWGIPMATDIAFADLGEGGLLTVAKLGILVASLLAGAGGWLMLRRGSSILRR
jgi:NhaA family Na+:H+ antiporter